MTTKKTNNNKPEFGNDIEPGLIVFRANVTNGGMDGKSSPRMDGTPTDEEMVLINKFSRRGNLDPASLYAFDCTPSTQELDSYFTFMDTSSLINYASESKLGTPVMNSHRTGGRGMVSELPIGRSFNGMVENDPEKAGQQIFGSSAYMLRNNRANGSVNTDDIIAGMEAGINSDISIQFNFSPGTPQKNFEDRTWLRCTICGNDFLRSNHWDEGPDDCPHWPGEVYKSDGGRKQDLCTLGVINGHLTEYSAVFAGSTPGAIINKARLAASEGFFNRSMVRHLEDVYHTRLMDYATFTVPIIGAGADEARKEKTEGGLLPTPNEPKAEEKEPLSPERIEAEMVDKRVLDDAVKEGAKHALAELARSLMASGRNFSDDELALFSQIETKLAAGETNQANALLMRLLNPQPQEGQDQDGEYYDADAQDRQAGGLDGDEGEGSGDEPPASTVNLVSLSMAMSERQQFKGLQEENTRLKKENKRLVPLADIGEKAWAGLINLTIRSYVRAGLGSGDSIRGMLMQLPFDHVRILRDQYEEIALRLTGQHDQDEEGNLIYIGEGGRQTQASDPNRPNFQPAPVVNMPSRNIDTALYSSQGVSKARR